MVTHQYIPDIFYREVRVFIDKDNVKEKVVPKCTGKENILYGSKCASGVFLFFVG